ncbi:cytochrome P450 [Microdochium trichocladiopsis]|uniref:Cytochrome P450 n=1 Tax=Microdochium trichocladiopsis TaxID=1682393 RepID=A0A9P8XRN7_9PEZI|nr:cytochrome P450 [Microdochium trichocladiopsis]KAH7012677.1 cytochrome P450 [Microdochium trichocladiopsis]
MVGAAQPQRPSRRGQSQTIQTAVPWPLEHLEPSRRAPELCTAGDGPSSAGTSLVVVVVVSSVSVLHDSLAYFVAQSIYRVFLHPLAKVPGPWHYAITDLFYARRHAGGNWDPHLKTLHDKYGPAVRYTANQVSFNSAEAWHTIYGHKTQARQTFSKDPFFYTQPDKTTPNIIDANNDDHRRMRRILAHAFSEKAPRGQEELVNGYVDLFIQRMGEKAAAAEPINIVLWYNFCTFDLIGALAFGKPFGMLERGVYHPWVAMIFESIRILSYGQLLNRYPFLKPLAALLTPKKLVDSFAENNRLSRETALQRLHSGDQDREDFMSYILRNNNSDDEKVRARGLSEDEIAENAIILITAGSETTATQLSGATYMLLMNRDKYDTLVAEIRGAFASAEEITMNSVNNLEYLIAVFSESFRMYPPIPIALTRIVPEGGETVGGHYLPAKTVVGVHQWSSYQCEQNFFEPQRFLPERWLASVNTTDPRFVNDKRDVLQPFSVGPRNCIGKNLAYAEMRLILTRLLYSFDLELLPESRDWASQRIYTLWEKGELMIKITPAKR